MKLSESKMMPRGQEGCSYQLAPFPEPDKQGNNFSARAETNCNAVTFAR
ncbi:hypothetical protein SAMN05428936_101463 [Pelagibacterium halotolerans]|uniref:Uncharacterized protein n=1 Tax=Pelagibacterium halotolerans (strain DSM 22347 / JCM 15775 / CGMCC 1.7692 / B2) TaxID=1082931 RepID=G4RB65_PELHB|nr:hypothetical protein KKY_533 [Pelagibacterium halotolerans B2]SDZ90135.1 hypothetical protein SAMN05428936_101463 [Pelagibacterium halotolerans]